MMNGSQCSPYLKCGLTIMLEENVLVCNLIETYTQIKDFDSFTFNGRKKCFRYIFRCLILLFFLKKEKKKKPRYRDS